MPPKAELIDRRAQRKTKESVERATQEWVAWFNNHHLLEPIRNIPPLPRPSQTTTCKPVKPPRWQRDLTQRAVDYKGSIFVNLNKIISIGLIAFPLFAHSEGKKEFAFDVEPGSNRTKNGESWCQIIAQKGLQNWKRFRPRTDRTCVINAENTMECDMFPGEGRGPGNSFVRGDGFQTGAVNHPSFRGAELLPDTKQAIIWRTYRDFSEGMENNYLPDFWFIAILKIKPGSSSEGELSIKGMPHTVMRDALVNGAIITNFCSLTNHNPKSVNQKNSSTIAMTRSA